MLSVISNGFIKNTFRRYVVNQSLIFLRKYSQESLKFTDYDCIGFDVDCTLCRYKITPLIKLEYDILSCLLRENKGYPSAALNRPIEEDVDLFTKGIIIDIERGNLIKLDKHGIPDTVLHGSREVEQGSKIYATCDSVKDFLKRPVDYKRCVPMLDYFWMPTSLLFMRMVDFIDKQSHNNLPKKYHIFPDIIEAVYEMFSKKNLDSREGFFKELSKHPEDYYVKSDKKVLSWLKSLKDANKILFLATNSAESFVDISASYTLCKNWREYFDVGIFKAAKPELFYCNHPFLNKSNNEVQSDCLKGGGRYEGGNIDGLKTVMRKLTGKMNPKILFIGDHLVQDIYAPSKFADLDTVYICEELIAENISSSGKQHDDNKFLTSSVWGSYFEAKHGESTYWNYIMQEHSKICVPSIEYIANYPLNNAFYSEFPIEHRRNKCDIP